MRPMITNGGPHPADRWAEVTTDAILDLIQIEADSVTPEAAQARQAKRDLQPVLFVIFNAHHSRVQAAERGAVPKSLKVAADNVAAPLEPATDYVMEKMFAALAATPFAAHFAKPEVQAVLTQIVGQHTADVMHIERRYHHDRLTAKGA